MPGGSVNLTCVAVGAPMPYVKWMSGEAELTREEEMPIGRNVLELANIRQSANYTCVAISSLGVIQTTAQITVKGRINAVPSMSVLFFGVYDDFPFRAWNKIQHLDCFPKGRLDTLHCITHLCPTDGATFSHSKHAARFPNFYVVFKSFRGCFGVASRSILTNVHHILLGHSKYIYIIFVLSSQFASRSTK